MTAYFDCNATTPIEPQVIDIVRHYLEIEFGNAGSRTHAYGMQALQEVQKARDQRSGKICFNPLRDFITQKTCFLTSALL